MRGRVHHDHRRLRPELQRQRERVPLGVRAIGGEPHPHEVARLEPLADRLGPLAVAGLVGEIDDAFLDAHLRRLDRLVGEAFSNRTAQRLGGGRRRALSDLASDLAALSVRTDGRARLVPLLAHADVDVEVTELDVPASGSARVTIPSTISTSLRPVACAFTSSTRFLSSAGPVRCPDGPRKPWRASRSSSPRSSDARASSWRWPSSVVLTVMPLSTAACSPIRAARHALRRRRPPRPRCRAPRPARAPAGSARPPPDRRSAGVDVAVRRHLPQHVALAGLGGVRVLARREALRALRQPGQQRRLGEVDVAHRLAEVVARRLLAAVAAVPVVDLVQVEREDLLLRQLLRQLARQDDLLHLAAQRPLRREQDTSSPPAA